MRRLCEEEDLGKNKQKMVEKNTKSAKKEKKALQTTQISPKTPKIPPKNKEIFEEPQADKPQADKPQADKPQADEPEETHGLVECKHCKKDIEPFFDSSMDRWKCPSCNLMVPSPVISDSEQLKEVKALKDRPYEILSSRKINFSGNELAQAEMLIQSGVASNFNDLAKKAFNLIFIKEKLNKAFGNQNTMELNKEPNPEKTMKQIQEQKLMEAYIKSMDGGNKMDPMSMMMMMRMLENQDKGKSGNDNGFMNQLMMMQMQAMAKPQGDSKLQGEITELKHQMQMQQMMNQQAQMQQGNTSSQQFMQQMESIRAERDKDIKAAEIAAQQERDKNLSLAFDNRRIELESRLKSMEKEIKDRGSGQLATQRITQMKEEIAAIKEMSQVLGHKEKGAGEYISETISNVATQLQPAMTKYMEQKEQQKILQQQIQALPPEPAPVIEQPQNLAPQNPGPQNPEPQPSDMTETEKQMSSQMSDMYLRPSEKKVEKK